MLVKQLFGILMASVEDEGAVYVFSPSFYLAAFADDDDGGVQKCFVYKNALNIFDQLIRVQS